MNALFCDRGGIILAEPKLERRFLCSYAGQADYEMGAGKRYRVRYWANLDPKFGYNTGVLENEIIPLVGCVISDDSRKWHDFPPAEVVAQFPGFVGARFTRPNGEDKGYRVEYDGPEPTRVPDPQVSYYLTADFLAVKRIA